jgi:AcrR family transcriptional regulator
LSVSARKAREQSMRRELIIEAARQIFEAKGFNKTTVEEIAARAELGKGTIYCYFESKEQLYVAVLEKGLTVLKERIDNVTAKPLSSIEALEKIYDVYIEYHRAHKGFIELLLFQSDQQQLFELDGLVGGLKNMANSWLESMAKVLHRGIEQGEFQTMDVNKTAQMLLGIMLGMIINSKISQTTGKLVELKKPLFQMILEGIRHRGALQSTG